MKDKFKNLLEIAKANPVRLIFGVVILLGLVAGAIWIITWAISSLLIVFEKHFDILSMIGIAVIVIVALVAKKNKSAPPPAPTTNEELEREAAERTYVTIAEAVLPVFTKLSEAFPCYIKPIEARDMYSPSRARKNSEIWYYNYAAIKKGGEKADIPLTKRFLSDELQRFLLDREAHGLAKNTVFVGGVEYPALVIADTQDKGSFLEVSIAVMSEKVYRHLNYRQNNAVRSQSGTNTLDDEQFL